MAATIVPPRGNRWCHDERRSCMRPSPSPGRLIGLLALVPIVGLLLVACGEGSGPRGPEIAGGGASDTTLGDVDDLEDPSDPGIPGRPPPVVVRSDDASVELEPFTYCYENGCADGIAPDDPPDLGRSSEVTVAFPLPSWQFTAEFVSAGDDCSRRQEVPLERRDDGTFVLRPAGHAGTYDVTLAGRGNGDLFVTFRWTTPTDGPLPAPEARLALLADHDGEVDSYGIELMVENLAQTPSEATATITVTAPNGRTLTFDATQEDLGCSEGTVYWGGPDDQGLAASALDDQGPFTYDVVLVLDGIRYSATATWPTDVIIGNEPSVALDFQPSLPALT